MAFETEGTVHKIFPTENKTASFQAREFVIKQDSQYPQFIKFQLTQDRCDLIDKFKEGDAIKVHFDLRGREWNEKYFTNLNAWRLEAPVAEQADQPQQTGSFTPIEEPFDLANDTDQAMKAEDFSDLPF